MLPVVQTFADLLEEPMEVLRGIDAVKKRPASPEFFENLLLLIGRQLLRELNFT